MFPTFLYFLFLFPFQLEKYLMQTSANEKATYIPGLRLKLPIVQNQNPVSTIYENCTRCGLKSPEFTFPTEDEELSKNKQQFKCTLKIR